MVEFDTCYLNIRISLYVFPNHIFSAFFMVTSSRLFNRLFSPTQIPHEQLGSTKADFQTFSSHSRLLKIRIGALANR